MVNVKLESKENNIQEKRKRDKCGSKVMLMNRLKKLYYLIKLIVYTYACTYIYI